MRLTGFQKRHFDEIIKNHIRVHGSSSKKCAQYIESLFTTGFNLDWFHTNTLRSLVERSGFTTRVGAFLVPPDTPEARKYFRSRYVSLALTMAETQKILHGK